MITNLYIDGFNLYYRALKDTPFRWLDLRKLAETLFPQDSINRVSYFTARLDVRPGNPGQAQRQLIYLRALATLPGFDSYFGVGVSAPSAGGISAGAAVLRPGKGLGGEGIGREPRHSSLGRWVQRGVRAGGRRVQRRRLCGSDAVYSGRPGASGHAGQPGPPGTPVPGSLPTPRPTSSACGRAT